MYISSLDNIDIYLWIGDVINFLMSRYLFILANG